MIEKFKLKVDDNKLSLSFKNPRTPYIMIILSILIQEIAIISIFFYIANDISMTVIITFISISIVISSFVAWYFTWVMLSRKKLELDSSGVIYSKELFGKIKSDTYRWLDIEKFANNNYRNVYFLTIKQSDATEIQLFYGVNKDEIEDILSQLNKFKNSILER